jgi:hypothetical protein
MPIDNPHLVILTWVTEFDWTREWNWLDVSKRNANHSEKRLLQLFSDLNSQKLELSINLPKLQDLRQNRLSVQILSWTHIFITRLYWKAFCLDPLTLFHYQYPFHLRWCEVLLRIIGSSEKATRLHHLRFLKFSSRCSIDDVNISGSPFSYFQMFHSKALSSITTDREKSVIVFFSTLISTMLMGTQNLIKALNRLTTSPRHDQFTFIRAWHWSSLWMRAMCCSCGDCSTELMWIEVEPSRSTKSSRSPTPST